jgi:hypothetical protein
VDGCSYSAGHLHELDSGFHNPVLRCADGHVTLLIKAIHLYPVRSPPPFLHPSRSTRLGSMRESEREREWTCSTRLVQLTLLGLGWTQGRDDEAAVVHAWVSVRTVGGDCWGVDISATQLDVCQCAPPLPSPTVYSSVRASRADMPSVTTTHHSPPSCSQLCSLCTHTAVGQAVSPELSHPLTLSLISHSHTHTGTRRTGILWRCLRRVATRQTRGGAARHTRSAPCRNGERACARSSSRFAPDPLHRCSPSLTLAHPLSPSLSHSHSLTAHAWCRWRRVQRLTATRRTPPPCAGHSSRNCW